MKLASHYNRSSIIISVAVLIVGAVIYYFTINYIATNQLNQDLTEEFEEVIDYVNLHKQLPKQVDFDEEETVFIKTDQKKLPLVFYNTTYKDKKENKVEAGRAVSGLVTLNGVNYKVIITVSRESSEDLIGVIIVITLALMTVFLIVIILTNKFILNDLWKPFYETLNEMKKFNVAVTPHFNINHKDVDEFDDLNKAAYGMSTRVISDFQNLKHFTESASHEMMTPLAVITTKLDTLIQDETLNENQLAQITDIYASINKSTRLNQSLLLLAKLDNNLINDSELVNLKEIILEKIISFQESILSKNITVVHRCEDKSILASKHLIDILLNNLLSNAIRHNYQNGQIEIILSDLKLTIKNTGNKFALSETQIFERFKKGPQSQGTGLGLTLVKNICQHYQFGIHYSYEAGWHILIIAF